MVSVTCPNNELQNKQLAPKRYNFPFQRWFDIHFPFQTSYPRCLITDSGQGRFSDLSAYFRTPSRTLQRSVAWRNRRLWWTYSYGYSSGFAPDSLLLTDRDNWLLHLSATKLHKDFEIQSDKAEKNLRRITSTKAPRRLLERKTLLTTNILS